MVRPGYGKKDGSRRGRNVGGRGRNRTSICRHPQSSRKGNKSR